MAYVREMWKDMNTNIISGGVFFKFIYLNKVVINSNFSLDPQLIHERAFSAKINE